MNENFLHVSVVTDLYFTLTHWTRPIQNADSDQTMNVPILLSSFRMCVRILFLNLFFLLLNGGPPYGAGNHLLAHIPPNR